MLRGLNGLIGRRVVAIDGEIGRIRDFYLDDEVWVVRYLAVDAGEGGKGKPALISDASFIQPRGEDFPVRLSKEQVRSSPGADLARPVSRRHEIALSRHYGWPRYWEGKPFSPGTAAPRAAAAEEEPAGIQSTRELGRCRVAASDGPAGAVSDCIADDATWKIYYLAVDAREVSPGKTVLLPALWARVDESAREIRFDVSREKMRESPPFDPARPISRSFEVRLFDYFGMPPYWRR